jgi:GNAT superfamily N-acetyltransferase
MKRAEILRLAPLARLLFERALLEDGAAGGRDVGFGLMERAADGGGHLHQLSVLPDAGRRGFGTLLLEHLVARARGRGRTAMTLITYADVPWNRPFYERRGFAVLDADALPSHVEAQLREERLAGLDPGRRVAMARELTDEHLDLKEPR